MPKSPHFFQKEQIIIQKQSSRCVLSKRFTTLLKSHFGKGVLLWICCIFSEQLFLRTPLDICLWPLLFTVVHLTDSRHSAPVDKFSKITDGLCYAQVFLSLNFVEQLSLWFFALIADVNPTNFLPLVVLFGSEFSVI